MKKILQRHLSITLAYVACSFLQVATCLSITGCSKHLEDAEKGQISKRKEATTNTPAEAAMEGEIGTMEGERETMEGEIGTMEGKRAAVDRDKERAAMEGMTQSFQQEKVKTQKRLKNLLDRHKNDQEVSNKKRDNAKHVTHNKKIAACKAHKERKQRQVEEILVNQTGQDTPTQDQADS